MSADRRNEYRAVSFMSDDEEYWRVEVRRWWWPGWTYVATGYDLNRARMKAAAHASKDSYVRKVENFGRLP